MQKKRSSPITVVGATVPPRETKSIGKNVRLVNQQDITTLSDGLRALYVGTDSEAVRQISAAWPIAAPVEHIPVPNDLPVTDWLPQAMANAPQTAAGLVGALTDTSDRLHWKQTYSKDDLGQRFLDRYGWVLLVGLDAPVKSDTLLAGFLLLGPDVEYPVHKHAAEEVYVILSGRASWKIGDADWQCKAAGSIIHNPSWQPHGMRTDQGEPLLVGFMWDADKLEKSVMAAR